MKHLALPACLLFLFFASKVRAQQSNPPQSQQVSTSPVASVQPVLTPRQMAELKGDILMARKMYPQAIETYVKLSEQEPKNAVLFNKIGVAYEELNDYGKSEHFFKRAIKADKYYASAYNNVGTVEYARHRYKGAIKWYDKTIKLRTDMATVYSNLGYAYFAWKKMPQAMAAFEQALRINPLVFQEHGENGSLVQQRSITDPGLFYFFVARTYAEMGNAERAAHYLKMARDDGYKKFVSAKTDPAFASVIKDPRVKQVFMPVPVMAGKSL